MIFSPSFSFNDLENLRKASKSFIKYLKQNEEKILEIIPQLTGFEWEN
jgi:hypothetical protein